MVRFISVAFVVVKFQMLLWQCSIHEMAAFGGFLGPFYLKYGLSLLKFQPEVVFHEKKTASEQPFKIIC